MSIKLCVCVCVGGSFIIGVLEQNHTMLTKLYIVTSNHWTKTSSGWSVVVWCHLLAKMRPSCSLGLVDSRFKRLICSVLKREHSDSQCLFCSLYKYSEVHKNTNITIPCHVLPPLPPVLWRPSLTDFNNLFS